MAEHQVDPKRNLPLYGAADESTSATDKEDDVENVRQNGSAPPIEEARESNEAPAADEYPHGLSLFFIVLAIMLATFIISLDQVSGWLYTLLQYICTYSNFARQLSVLPSPKSPINSTVSTKYHGTARHTS